MEWSATKQQVFAFESDIVVSAGAGSGKTAALVELYLRLLAGETRFHRELTVEDIVAITFTDKAALEMKERVRSGMTQRMERGDSSLLWKGHLRALPAAPIATFHAFCARLLRENPAEAGIDPAFSLLDELAAWGELRGALDEVIEAELKERTPGIRGVLEQYPLSGAGRGKGLREHLLDLRRKRSVSGMDDEQLYRLADQWEAAARNTCATLPARLESFTAGARSSIRERELKGGKEPAFLGKMRAFLELCESAQLAADSEIIPGLLEMMLECMKGSWGKEDAGFKEEIKEFLESMQLSFRQVKSAPLAAALLSLSGKLENAYRIRKQRRGALDFDDLQIKARDLLRNEGAVRDDCRRRFPVVMVDEFQDTNPLQKELLELLCGEEQRLFIVGDPKQSIYLFRGADVSVFGHTQAETAGRGGRNLYFQESFRSREGIIAFVNQLFSGVMGTEERGISPFDVCYGEGDHLQPERPDWDGTPCVELLTVAGDGTGSEKRNDEARAIARKILLLVSGDDRVRVYDRKAGTGDRGPGTGEQNLEPRTSNLEPDFLPRTPRFGDIALLFRRFTNLKLFERELRRCAIPYYVVKGKGFYRCQEVLDLLNFLRYLEFSGDLPALAGVLRSPLCGVSDETLYLMSRFDGGIGAWEKVVTQNSKLKTQNSTWDRIDHIDREKLRSLALLIERLRPLRDRLTLAELMEEVLTGTDFASSLYATYQGEQKAANLRKLIELCRSFTGEGEGGVRGFVAYLTELVEMEPTEAEAVISAEGEDVVRLMTVHQSKGLEFPVVFIPELGAGSPADHAPVQYDDAFGVGVKLASAGGGWEPTLASRAITELRSRKETAELKRLLYVATTRARDYLVLSGEKGRTRSGAWRDWVDAFLEGEGASLLKVTRADLLAGEPERDASGLSAASGDGGHGPAGIAAGIRRALHFTTPLPSSMVFSPTALEDYANCPRKYYYKSVMGLDEGLFAELLGTAGGRGKDVGRGMTPLEKGNFAHMLLEKIDFSADSASQRAAGLRIAAACAPDPEDKGIYEVIDHVVAFATSSPGRALADRKLLREWPFTLKLAGEGSYYIRGAMDLVVPEADRVTVYDYKYLHKKDADLEGYRFQLRTYMLALSRAWPGLRIGGRLLFLRGGDEETVECDAPAFEARLLRIMDAIRNRSVEEEFGLRDGCDGTHCPFRQRCLKSGSTFDVLR